MRISAARSSTRLDEGETSMAFSLRARPFMHRLSAACFMSATILIVEIMTRPCASYDDSKVLKGDLGQKGEY